MARGVAVCYRTKETPIVPRQLDDFRERNQPQIGTVHDPLVVLYWSTVV